MNQNIGYIYLTTNLIDNKKYIGKRQKNKFDKNYKGSGKYLKRAINKYGKDNFETKIIQWCKTTYELNFIEKYWIKYFNAQENNEFYNISPSGDWGDISKGMTKEQYEEWGNKISIANTGKKRSEETRLKMSQSMKSKKRINKKNIIIANTGKNNPMYGKKHSEETIQKMKENSKSKKKGSNGIK